MARGSNEIEVAWKSLEHGEANGEWRTISITPAGLCKLSAGLRYPRKEQALLVGFSNVVIPATEVLPDGAGFVVERIDPYRDGFTWLALTRREHGDIGLFLTMVCDLAGMLDDLSASNGVALFRSFIGRARAWQEFMRKGAQILSPEEEIGLVGELTMLSILLATNLSPETCIDAWVGPFDAVQDYVIGTGAIEVKSTITIAGFPATIGSLGQLDDSTRQPLFIAGVRLRQDTTGQSLPEIVESACSVFRTNPAIALRFSERIIAAGYFDAHADRYQRKYHHVATKLLLVNEFFPRLTIGSVPTGIYKAKYEIDLDTCENPSLDIAQVLKHLGVIE